MSAYREILKIKACRQDKAERAVARAHQALIHCDAQHAVMENRLQEYRVYANDKERECYRDLCARVVRLADIEDVQFTVQQLREQESTHEKALDKAEKARQDARETLRDDTEQLQVANKMHQKFVELTTKQTQELVREVERGEEMELEEVAARDRYTDAEHES